MLAPKARLICQEQTRGIKRQLGGAGTYLHRGAEPVLRPRDKAARMAQGHPDLPGGGSVAILPHGRQPQLGPQSQTGRLGKVAGRLLAVAPMGPAGYLRKATPRFGIRGAQYHATDKPAHALP